MQHRMQPRARPRRLAWRTAWRTPAPGCMALIVAALAGCAPGAFYQPPRIDLPDGYQRLAAVPAPPAAMARWWTGFDDPVLDALVARGLTDSVSVAVAAARLREADAQARRAGNTVTGNLSFDAQAGASSDTRGSGLSMSLDPFGARARAADAAMARLEAARYGVQDARLTLLSSLAQTYVQLRYFQDSATEQRIDLASRRRTLRDIETLLAAGSATELDRLRAEALVAETQARIPPIEASAAQQANRLATLLGVPAGSLGIDLAYRGRQPVMAARAAVGIPADLLRRRPDIRQAERVYAAAVSEVAAAEAARYPSLSLSGNIVAPRNPALPFAGDLAAGLVLPLFSQPGLAAGVDAARAQADQAYLQWRGAVLSAVEEVQSALASVAASRRAVAASVRVVRLDTQALDLSRRMLTGSGEVTVLDILDRERAVSDARSTLSANRRDDALGLVALYSALGFGVEPAVGNPPAPGLSPPGPG